jgi:hypothetical protein
MLFKISKKVIIKAYEVSALQISLKMKWKEKFYNKKQIKVYIIIQTKEKYQYYIKKKQLAEKANNIEIY